VHFAYLPKDTRIVQQTELRKGERLSIVAMIEDIYFVRESEVLGSSTAVLPFMGFLWQ
jgi:hypothetical protein